MRVGLALTFLLTSVTFACDICKAPQRSAGDDAGESVLELSLDSLESVVDVHSLVVLLLYDDRAAARQRLQSFARAATALKELETGDELETGESVVLGRIDVASYAEVAHRLEARRMPSRTPHAACHPARRTPHAARRTPSRTPHAACRTRATPNRRSLPASNLIRRHRLCRAQVPRSALPAVRLLRGDVGFGYEFAGMGPDRGRSVEAMAQELVSGVMDEVWHGGDKAVARLSAEEAEAWRAANDTRVVATLHRPESMRAFVQVRPGQRRARTAPHRTAPHRTAPHRTAPHRRARAAAACSHTAHEHG